MLCSISGCTKPTKFKSRQLCQMHYFRHMRNGSFELRKPNVRTVEKGRGYVTLWLPSHPLSDSRGHVREHRAVYHDNVCSGPTECAMCSAPITWATLHIDHIDGVTGNNNPDNLRALCRGCNVFRAHTPGSMGSMFIELDGLRLTPTAWSRMPGVVVAAATIRNRKKKGWSNRDAIYGKRKTHQHRSPAQKAETKYDELRGIPSKTEYRDKRIQLENRYA